MRGLLRALLKLVPEGIKRIFATRQQMAKLHRLELELVPGSVLMNVGPAGYGVVRVTIHNRSPVMSLLDRIVCEVEIAGIHVSLVYLHREPLPGYSSKTLPVRVELSEGQKLAIHSYGLREIECDVYGVAYLDSLRWPIAADFTTKAGSYLKVMHRRPVTESDAPSVRDTNPDHDQVDDDDEPVDLRIDSGIRVTRS